MMAAWDLSMYQLQPDDLHKQHSRQDQLLPQQHSHLLRSAIQQIVTMICKPLTAGANSSAAHQSILNMSSTVMTALGADSITVWTGISKLMSVMYSRLKRKYLCQLTKRACDGSGSSTAAWCALLYTAAAGEAFAGEDAGVA
jgi:hypothetical protein